MDRQLLIFDLDGTLIDSRSDLTTGINLMRAHYALSPLSQETVSSYIGGGVRNLVERSLQKAKVDIEEALDLTLKFYTEHILDQTEFYPHVEAGLKTLFSNGHTLALLSNKPGDLTRQIMKQLGTADYFRRILGGGDLENLKPAPDGIYQFIDQTGISAHNCWMIGDHHTDLETAHNAGVRSGFVSYGIGQPGKFTADQTWPGFAELVDYFLGLNSKTGIASRCDL